MALPTSNNGVATTRTTWNALVALYIAYALQYLIDTYVDFVSVPSWVAPAVAAGVLGFVYRGSLLLSQYKWWGVILFLINRAPGYVNEPEGEPQPEEVEAPAQP